MQKIKLICNGQNVKWPCMNCESACGDVVVCGSTLKINHLYFDLSVNHIPAVLSHTLLF